MREEAREFRRKANAKAASDPEIAKQLLELALESSFRRDRGRNLLVMSAARSTSKVEDQMADASEEVTTYPLMGWRTALEENNPICMVQIVFARDLDEAARGAKGGELPGVPLGLTANQCRELGADLVEAANKLDGRKRLA